VNRFTDPDGVVRRIPLFINYKGLHFPSLSFIVACKYLRCDLDEVKIFPGRYIQIKNIKIPIDNFGRMLINYVGYPKSFRYISYHQILRRRIPKDYFKEKIVLIGGTATGLGDYVSTPLSGRIGEHPGVEVHANIIHNIINNNFLKRISPSSNFLLILFLALMGAFIAVRFKALGIIFLSFIILMLYFLINYLLFSHGLWFEVVRPVSSFILSSMGVITYRFLTEEKEKRRIRSIFQRYVPIQVVREILINPDKLSLGGQKKEITILFSDIRGFTSMSEEMSPEEVVNMLNEYLSEMTKVVFENGGTLDKFIGDAVMALFNVPLEQPDHALRAVKCALGMQNSLSKLNEKWKSEGRSTLQIGIGINTGEAVVGNIGSPIRMEYTAIGDNVNLASRLEGVNKIYETNILISKSTYEKVKEEIITGRKFGVKVKGKKDVIEIFEVIGVKG
jgi:adenylate cyclase